MKICFPVQKDDGIDSAVYSRFGSAPFFVIVDTVTDGLSTINNRDQHHTHGACNPMKALNDQKVDAIVVGGISAGTLTRLNQMGIIVHRSAAATIRKNMAMIVWQKLPTLTHSNTRGGRPDPLPAGERSGAKITPTGR